MSCVSLSMFVELLDGLTMSLPFLLSRFLGVEVLSFCAVAHGRISVFLGGIPAALLHGVLIPNVPVERRPVLIEQFPVVVGLMLQSASIS